LVPQPRFECRLEHLFNVAVQLEKDLEIIAPLPEGIRINAYISGGHIEGPRLRGKIRPVGGDWITLRRDGIGEMEVRATAETEDGALIHVAYGGVIDFGEDGYEKALSGETPERLPIRAAPRYRTPDPRYAWLNRLQLIAIGEVNLLDSEVRIDIYTAV
jgi:hypothetical protein